MPLDLIEVSRIVLISTIIVLSLIEAKHDYVAFMPVNDLTVNDSCDLTVPKRVTFGDECRFDSIEDLFVKFG